MQDLKFYSFDSDADIYSQECRLVKRAPGLAAIAFKISNAIGDLLKCLEDRLNKNIELKYCLMKLDSLESYPE
jgi:hypothetical protein